MSRITTAAMLGNLWPGLTRDTAEEFVRVGRGLPIRQSNKFAQLHSRFYHQLGYATIGHTQLTYFNVPAAEHVCNLNNGTAPDDRPFWLTGISVDWQDLDSAGNRIFNATQFSIVPGAFAGDRADQIRTILTGGLLQLFVSERLIHEGQNLFKYPVGGGFEVGASSVQQLTATAGQQFAWTNGVAHVSNIFRFPRPYPVLPGKPIRTLLKWPSALSVGVGGRIKIEFTAESVVPLNQ